MIFETYPISIGVIADTHIPDRRTQLDERILPLLRERGVRAILHAGDVTVSWVLEEMAQVAPVYAVRGNRDIWGLKHLPEQLELKFGGVAIGLAHGHGGWMKYLADRPVFMLLGYHHERLLPRLRSLFPLSNVIVFGHGHLALNRWIDGQLFFNPGSPHFPARRGIAPSLGFLHILDEGQVSGEIVKLV
jgi:putative phosphoesterase